MTISDFSFIAIVPNKMLQCTIHQAHIFERNLLGLFAIPPQTYFFGPLSLFEQLPFTLCQHPFPRRNDFYSLIIQRQSRLFTNSDNGQLVAAGRF